MFMNNMKEETTDAMKETTDKVVHEKEIGTAESIETIKNVMESAESADGIDRRLPRFLAIWSALSLILYSISYFVGSWIAYLYCAAPLIAWSTFGFTYIRKKKRLVTYNVVERRMLSVWTFIALITPFLLVSLKYEISNFFPFSFTVFSIALAGLCLRMVERTNNISVSLYILFAYYGLLHLIDGDFDFSFQAKILSPLFLLCVLIDSFNNVSDISYKERNKKQ